MNASQPEPELEVEGPAANLTPNKQNPGLCQWFMVTHNACLSSEQPTTAATGAGDSDGNSSSVQSHMPGIDSEPEDATTEPKDWDGDLGVAALDEVVN